MNCNNCKQVFTADEIDSGGLCYDCANLDPDYIPPTTELVKELLQNSLERLAAAKGTSAAKLKSELVSEHVYNNPDKYIRQVVESIGTKKNRSVKN